MAYATVDELALALRVRLTPENTGSLQACLDAAAAEIEDAIDAPAGTVTPAGVWLWSSLTGAADPGAGAVRANMTGPAEGRALYVSGLDAYGDDRSAGLGLLAPADLVQLDDGAGGWTRYQLTGPAVDNGGWFTLPADLDSSGLAPGSPLEGQQVSLVFARPAGFGGPKRALVNRVNLLRGVEWYKANDAAFGVIGFDESGALQLPRSTFARHAATLVPLKQQWGVA